MQPASGQVCFNCIDGHSGDDRYFFQTFFFHIKQQDGRPLFGIQLIQCQIKCLMVKGLIRLFGSSDYQAFHFDRAVAFSRFFSIAEAVVGNPEQPSGEGRPSTKRFQMQKGLDEGLLGDVVGQGRVSPAEITKKPAERFLVDLNL